MQLGRYRLTDELGTGGMATVFAARDLELRRDVAVKVLFPHLARSREVVSRFHREARAAAGLDHRHILRVLDVGGGRPDDDADPEREVDPPYIVLELVRGSNLAQAVGEGAPVLAEVVVAIGVALASALGEAHRAGIVHRDVKPANLMIAEGGRLVLADFGVARVSEEDSLVTRTGALLGTPAFMSPEQATAGELDARSDLYSMGATLYQLATGSLPVTGGPAKAVAAILAGEIIPPLRRNRKMGAGLARIIERLMQVDAAARYASAAEVEAALRAHLAESGAGEDADALVAEWAADRAACEARLGPVVLATTVRRAREAADRGEAPKALALCDRALALDASCAEATEIAERVGRRGRGVRVAFVAGAVAVLGVVGGGFWILGEHSPAARALDAGPTIAAA
ncbi:MAG TPA: serine/threonine-protein kinase, partial [Kofleriaceae bacterium]|nr:serine/threonine-protein kinase [Kofleriaceae bacterium]